MKRSGPKFTGLGEGHTVRLLGTSYTTKVPAADTGGAFCLLEVLVPAQAAVPPHVHHREDEMFYVLEGTVEIHCAGKTFTATKGATVSLPRDVPHWFRNSGTAPARFLALMQPAGFEGFFEEASKLPADAPPDLAKLAAIGEKYGLELLPPE